MTFSLAGRCRDTGMLGGVVTTSSPAVGARCLWPQAGTGVVLTQFWTDPRLGPRGLALLAEACPARRDPPRRSPPAPPTATYRQLAVLDAQGQQRLLPRRPRQARVRRPLRPGLRRHRQHPRQRRRRPAAMVAAFEAAAAQPLSPNAFSSRSKRAKSRAARADPSSPPTSKSSIRPPSPTWTSASTPSAAPLPALRALYVTYLPHGGRHRRPRPHPGHDAPRYFGFRPMMHLVTIPNPVGGHLGGWRHPDAFPDTVMNLQRHGRARPARRTRPVRRRLPRRRQRRPRHGPSRAVCRQLPLRPPRRVRAHYPAQRRLAWSPAASASSPPPPPPTTSPTASPAASPPWTM